MNFVERSSEFGELFAIFRRKNSISANHSQDLRMKDNYWKGRGHGRHAVPDCGSPLSLIMGDLQWWDVIKTKWEHWKEVTRTWWKKKTGDNEVAKSVIIWMTTSHGVHCLFFDSVRTANEKGSSSGLQKQLFSFANGNNFFGKVRCFDRVSPVGSSDQLNCGLRCKRYLVTQLLQRILTNQLFRSRNTSSKDTQLSEKHNFLHIV